MLSSRDLSSPESRSISDMRAVNTLVIEPILNPVSAVGGPLVGSENKVFLSNSFLGRS